jgi:hypothetical protein
VTGRAREERPGQHAGAGWLHAGGLQGLAVIILLAAGATPGFAAKNGAAHGDPRTADVLVAKLRDMPLPRRPFAHGLAPAKAGARGLPALEVRRQRVYDALHALGPASVTALARALRDPDPQMRRNVAVALDVVGGGWWQFPDGRPQLDLRPALPALLAALQDSDADVRAWAAQDLGDMGAAAGPAVPRLRAMLHRPDAESRGSACRALGQIGAAAHAALPDLRRALADSSPAVRQAALAAIVSIQRSDALRRTHAQ